MLIWILRLLENIFAYYTMETPTQQNHLPNVYKQNILVTSHLFYCSVKSVFDLTSIHFRNYIKWIIYGSVKALEELEKEKKSLCSA